MSPWLTPIETAAEFDSQLLIATVLPAWCSHLPCGSAEDSFPKSPGGKLWKGTNLRLRGEMGTKINRSQDIRVPLHCMWGLMFTKR